MLCLILFTGMEQIAVGQADTVDYSKTKRIIENLSDPAAVEYAPSISADGKTIIFEANKGGSYKLFESKFINDDWQLPEPIENVNNFGDSTDLIGGPSISFDGNTLYFFASIGFGNSSDIYYSTRDKSGWSVPQTIGAAINTDGYEAFPSISADGKYLYFVRQNMEGPQSRDLKRYEGFCSSIWRAERNANGEWGTPRKLPYPINLDCEKAPRIMADGKTLIFSSNRPGGQGDYDMYQSTFTPLGEWSRPVPLTYANSAASDQLPTIAAQGDLMYFVYNNQDIYSVVIPPDLRQFVNNIIQGKITDADTDQGIAAKIIVRDALTSSIISEIDNNPEDGAYTVVLAAGKYYNIEVVKEGYSSFIQSFDLRKVTTYQESEVNIELFQNAFLDVAVSDAELFEGLVADVQVKRDGASTFFKTVKTRLPNGTTQIALPIGSNYEFYVSAPNFKSELFTLDLSNLVLYRNFEKEIPLVPEKKEVMINVADLVNNSRVKSKIILRNKDRDERIEVDGNNMVSLRVGDRYEIEATSDQGYAFNSTTLEVGKNSQGVDLKLLKLEQNAKLELKDILFESNSATLSDISYIELERVIKLMNENPTLRVEVAAHTDDVGSDSYNKILSNKRANSVVTFLEENKIAENRFEYNGYGESQPKVANDSDENRAKNRRVELIVIGI
ncbi:OmpA family protein [Fulvivirga lutea]|uniref:PD40 domain-containing protein n=1 Tax=Fulvivirga lutea TaxID=2810512 RepID=A0A974WKK3_9BACT|nr:OmpA family protein [Fulvivirga lutea]QSE98897.1 PD40 domain-containing protein [Fulvivirga lutea]